ncbi:MAG: CHAD domain-containing protein, partial [Planctomycetales bacterium]|nr:CHAD domain-containing protein [Planctomycetales bacterium]
LVRDSFQRVGENPEHLVAEYELGNLLLSTGKPGEAVPLLEAVAQDNPRFLDGRQAFGLSLRGVDRTEEARAELEYVQQARTALKEVDELLRAISGAPGENHADHNARIGELYTQWGSLKTAEVYLRLAVAEDPGHPLANSLLADYYERLAATNPAYQQIAKTFRERAQENHRPTNE